jgi:hypothetical protein
MPSFPVVWVNSSWNGSFSRVACRRSGEGEGTYPYGGVSYPRLAHLHPLAARVLREFIQSPGRDILGALAMRFWAKKWDHFWGEYPHSSLRGGLGFLGESRVTLWLILTTKFYICTTN